LNARINAGTEKCAGRHFLAPLMKMIFALLLGEWKWKMKAQYASTQNAFSV
jgi:hypothetical protein